MKDPWYEGSPLLTRVADAIENGDYSLPAFIIALVVLSWGLS